MDECRTFCDSLTFIGNLCIGGILNFKAKKFLKISFLHNLILINIKDTIEWMANNSLVLVRTKIAHLNHHLLTTNVSLA